VYARAAAAVIGMDRMTPEQWDQMDVFQEEKPAEKKLKKRSRGESIWD
jgi:hypothetical protein